jgi:hypothetical protein
LTSVTSNSTSSIRSESRPPFGPGVSSTVDGRTAKLPATSPSLPISSVPLTPSPGRISRAVKTAWPARELEMLTAPPASWISALASR